MTICSGFFYFLRFTNIIMSTEIVEFIFKYFCPLILSAYLTFRA